MNLKELPNCEKPRERFLKYGRENISNNELIEIILKSGTRKTSIKEISHNILSSVNNINELKYTNDNYSDLVYLTDPSSIINYFHDLYAYEKQELFYVIYLDNQKKYIDKKLLFKGTVNFSLVHPREIFKEAYLLSASYIICIHNHPSGNASPSKNDIDITKRIKNIGDIHGIGLLDHIIIGHGNYYSFYEDNNL